jgi:membrane glycosyltransferase
MFIICMTVIMLPKVLALVDLALDSERRRAFGGLTRATLSVLAETVFSTLHAPLQMLWHTRFVITILLGMGVSWGTQNRDADGTEWSYALRRQWGHVLVGVVWGGLVFWLDEITFWWFLPVLLGNVLSIPLSVLTSRSNLGATREESRLVSRAGRSRAATVKSLTCAYASGMEMAAENSPRARLMPAWPMRS